MWFASRKWLPIAPGLNDQTKETIGFKSFNNSLLNFNTDQKIIIHLKIGWNIELFP